MPRVRKVKSGASGFYDGAGKGRERRTNTRCSWFVLAAASAMIAVCLGRIDLQTVICQGPSVSREVVAAAKLQLPADASMTLRWRPFQSGLGAPIARS